MTDDFDPYWEWLGIRADERPVDHYRLLGLDRFTSDTTQISAASDERMGHVRNFQTGPRGAHTQRLLNELAAARVCLLNPQTRKTYDDFLRGLAAASLASAPPASQPAAPYAAPSPQAAPAWLPPSSSPVPRATAWHGGPTPPSSMAAPPAPPPIAAALEDPASYAASNSAAATQEAVESFVEAGSYSATDELPDDYVPIAARPWFPVLVIAAVIFVASAVWAVGRHWGRTEVAEHAESNAEGEPSPSSESGETGETGESGESPSSASKNSTSKSSSPKGKPASNADDYPTEVVIAQEGNGSVNLTAASARWTSANLQLATSAGGDASIVGWTGDDDSVEWTFRIIRPDVFRVEITYAAEEDWAGGRFEIAIDEATKTGDVVSTGGIETFRTDRVFLPVKKSGRHQLTVRAVERKGEQLWALQSIRLLPQGISGKDNRGK